MSAAEASVVVVTWTEPSSAQLTTAWVNGRPPGSLRPNQVVRGSNPDVSLAVKRKRAAAEPQQASAH
jgi:hypothetical protein